MIDPALRTVCTKTSHVSSSCPGLPLWEELQGLSDTVMHIHIWVNDAMYVLERHLYPIQDAITS